MPANTSTNGQFPDQPITGGAFTQPVYSPNLSNVNNSGQISNPIHLSKLAQLRLRKSPDPTPNTQTLEQVNAATGGNFIPLSDYLNQQPLPSTSSFNNNQDNYNPNTNLKPVNDYLDFGYRNEQIISENQQLQSPPSPFAYSPVNQRTQGFTPNLANESSQNVYNYPVGAINLDSKNTAADPASYANLNTSPLQQVNQIPLPSNASNNIVATNGLLKKSIEPANNIVPAPGISSKLTTNRDGGSTKSSNKNEQVKAVSRFDDIRKALENAFKNPHEAQTKLEEQRTKKR
jgi:hypothetical protein